MRSALAGLDLERLYVVHAGRDSFELADRSTALALSRLAADLEPVG